MPAKQNILALSLLVLAAPAFADLYVSPVLRDTVRLDTAAGGQVRGSSTVHGDFVMQAPSQAAMRYGKNVPLFVALEHVIPDSASWKVNIDRGLENRVVSWDGGDTYEEVLAAIGDQNGLSIVMNSVEKTIGVSEEEKLSLHLAKKEQEVWHLEAGKTLKDNLEQWAQDAGWQLSWDERLRIDYPILHSAVLTGPFAGESGVVDRLLAAFKDQPRPLTATFHTGNRVLRITEAGYRQENK